jgi:hypothetical protein
MRSSCLLTGWARPRHGVALPGFALPAFKLLAFTLLAVWSAPAAAGCELRSPGGAITHVVQIQLDNVHLRRDDPNVASDLEQMPNLLGFLAADGVVGGNHHAPPQAQQASDVLTVLTGLYGDRMGVPIADAYGYFRGDGSVGFSTALAYWTATGGDGKPLILSESGRTAPAPWVPFTRAGCDVGAFATAGLELQNLAPDVASVFGATSPEARAATGDPAKASADLIGIAVHCAHGSPLCATAHARPDLLPDEPGGYSGFSALFGNAHVQGAISPGGPVKDIDGHVILDAAGNVGFPGALEASAAQSLGYAATMLEAGVPVVYVALGDLHHQGVAAADRRALGPGEAADTAALAACDAAFKAFFDRLAADGITKANTLFMVVPTGNDHFVGGPPSPPGCDGTALPCSYGRIGAIETSINRLLSTERHNVTAFELHFGSAPAFYVRGNPLATDPLTRTLEQDVSKLTVRNPITDKTDNLAALLADRAEMQLLHMITASPARAPNFIMFGDPNYFNRTAPEQTDCAAQPPCVEQNPQLAWTHGDIQQVTGSSWFAMAGPGVARLGTLTEMASDHTDLRPTLLALVGLTDSYVHDGVVLVDALEGAALPAELQRSREAFAALARAYKDLNDPLGQLGRNSLALATGAIKGTDTDYERYLGAIGAITAARDALAREIKARLDGAAFAHRPLDPASAGALIDRAEALINRVEELAGSSFAPAAAAWKAANQH